MRFLFGQNSEADSAAPGADDSAFIDALRRAAGTDTYDLPEDFLALPTDERVIEETSSVVHSLCQVVPRYIVLIGVGGSSLGARAVYDALIGWSDRIRSSGTKIFFIEGSDHASAEAVLAELLDQASAPEDFLVVLVSKSGSTIETIAHAEFVLSGLQGRFPSALGRTIVVTDPDSPLRLLTSRGASLLSIPSLVGGRYSAFSAAGLAPLMAAGIDVPALLSGAEEMRDRCLASDASNPAYQSARFLKTHAEQGFRIHDVFLFAPELESVGRWYRQLLSESIGKDNAGIIPTVSIGSADMHSVGQLYLGGLHEATALFVDIEARSSGAVPEERLIPEAVPSLTGAPLSALTEAIQSSVEEAYQERGIPFMKATLERIDEHEVGAFLMWKECEMLFLARMFGVNPFDQPAVEAYKEKVEAHLSNRI